MMPVVIRYQTKESCFVSYETAFFLFNIYFLTMKKNPPPQFPKKKSCFFFKTVKLIDEKKVLNQILHLNLVRIKENNIYL
jgi:hypothetical protein